MQNSARTSSSYSLTLRIEYPNAVGTLGRVTSVIGENGGDIGAIDIVNTERGSITRDITFSAADPEHGQKIVQEVRGVAGVDIVNVSDRTFLLHLGGTLEIAPKVPVKTRDDLSMAYTPGVARISQSIVDDPQDVYNLTIKKNTVAVITDGSQVLGLGAAGPHAALPVMEGKALLFKEFGGVDAFPLCLDAKTTDDIVTAIRAVAPTFGAIHLEDFASPRCFAIEARLENELDIPVMHSDQHATAIAVLAALINALKIVKKAPEELRVVINGAGAAGVATTRLLSTFGARDIVMCMGGNVLELESEYSQGANSQEEGAERLHETIRNSNPRGLRGTLQDALRGADVFIGFGGQTVLTKNDIAAMHSDAIVFAMANPQPEIAPSEIEGIARIIATGKSDFPNQINNMLCFPGFFRGLLDARARGINDAMKIAAAHAIAGVVGVDELHEDYLIPSVFDRRVATAVAKAVVKEARHSGLARRVARTH